MTKQTSEHGQVIDMGETRGAITTFIVEPFMPHQQEFYLSMQSQRLGNDISFSQVPPRLDGPAHSCNPAPNTLYNEA